MLPLARHPAALALVHAALGIGMSLGIGLAACDGRAAAAMLGAHLRPARAPAAASPAGASSRPGEGRPGLSRAELATLDSVCAAGGRFTRTGLPRFSVCPP